MGRLDCIVRGEPGSPSDAVYRLAITVRPHTSQLPERAVDEALGLERLSASSPFVKKKAIELT